MVSSVEVKHISFGEHRKKKIFTIS